MEAIRIRNLRSLEDTGYIDIAPVTVLLGKNNSGKSTFLKTFLMLKQTFEHRVEGPLLFWGNHVDFGDFGTAITTGEQNHEFIELSFKFKMPYRLFENSEETHDVVTIIRVSQRDSKKDSDDSDNLYVSYISFLFMENIVEMNINSDNAISSVTVNESDFTDQVKHINTTDEGELFPIFVEDKRKEGRLVSRHYFGRSYHHTYEYSFILPNSVMKYLQNVASDMAHPETDSEHLMNIFSKVSLKTPENGLEHLVNVGSDIPGWTNKTSSWENEDDVKNKLQFMWNLVALGYFFRLRENATDYIQGLGQKLSYSAPVRASADRYYRTQNLALDEIDPSGENLPMYISNLKPDEMKLLQKWLLKNFDLHLDIQREKGHIKVLIGETKEKKYNITDTGFGLSQAMPILVQIWSLIAGRAYRRMHPRLQASPMFYLIEQPELHLHPEMQSKLAGIFSRAAENKKGNEPPLKIICETHSEAMIDRFGHEISQGRVSDEDINVVIFGKDPDTGITKIIKSQFDKNGQLENWPWGFFDPDVD